MKSNKNKKSIGIICPSGWGIKAFLLNDFYDVIVKECNLFIFSPLADDKNFKRNFINDSVFFEKLNIERFKRFKINFFDFFTYSYYYRRPTYINQVALKRIPAKNKFTKFKKLVLMFLSKFFGRFISIETQIFLEKILLGFKNEVKRLKETYKRNKIELVFSTTPLIAWYEHPALFAAKELGIKTACIITSWDNLASKGRIPIKFDYYFCWSDLMKKELKNSYSFIKDEQIFVVGAPQFDYYFKKDLLVNKGEFFKKIGADVNKKLILWSAASENQYPNEGKIFEHFYKNFIENPLNEKAQVVLRAHPIGGLKRFKSLLENYPELLKMETNSDDPKYLNRWMPSKEDIKDLLNILYYSDIVINHCSTMTLDACAFDRPVINISYDLEKDSEMEKYVRNCYNYDHYTCVFQLGAVKIVHSQEELFNAITEYLENPSKDREGRKRLLDLQIGFKDGFASKRIAEKLLEIL